MHRFPLTIVPPIAYAFLALGGSNMGCESEQIVSSEKLGAPSDCEPVATPSQRTEKAGPTPSGFRLPRGRVEWIVRIGALRQGQPTGWGGHLGRS